MHTHTQTHTICMHARTHTHTQSPSLPYLDPPKGMQNTVYGVSYHSLHLLWKKANASQFTTQWFSMHDTTLENAYTSRESHWSDVPHSVNSTCTIILWTAHVQSFSEQYMYNHCIRWAVPLSANQLVQFWNIMVHIVVHMSFITGKAASSHVLHNWQGS